MAWRNRLLEPDRAVEWDVTAGSATGRKQCYRRWVAGQNGLCSGLRQGRARPAPSAGCMRCGARLATVRRHCWNKSRLRRRYRVNTTGLVAQRGVCRLAYGLLSWRRQMDRGTRARGRPSRSFGLELADRLAVSSDLIYLVWRHKLWWMLPLLLAMIVLAALVVLEATPIGPLLYPVF